MTIEKATANAEEVFALFQQYGSADYIGEKVSQTEHAFQAAELAERDYYEDEVVLAALFHDIGHLIEFVQPAERMEEHGVVNHEKLGADYLREKGFSDKIARLVESHVAAKRYLTYKIPGYYNQLSDASKFTLEQQGGRMDETEAELFEQDDLHQLFIRLREWDDKAKTENLPLPGMEKYRQMAIKHLVNH
jgi:2-amino-1-hydroxyethylphosphonate dioxygenase (glycine-forming)